MCIHNNMIKLSYKCGLESVVDYLIHKVLISDTTLRSLIPPQDRKINPKSIHICGCELCIIPKDMQTILNKPRTRNVTYLKHSYVGRHTHTRLFSTISDAY